MYKLFIILLILNSINNIYGEWGLESCDLCVGDGMNNCESDYKICICNDGYTGRYCNISTDLVVYDYIPSNPNGGYGWLSGFYRNITDIIVYIGEEEISITPSQYSIQILVIGLDVSKTYDVLVKQGNLEWFGKDFYSPLGLTCSPTAYKYNNVCYCLRAWTGKTCSDPSPVAIDSVTPNVFPITGGDININGWFGNNTDNLNFIIDLSSDISIIINTINSTNIQGKIVINQALSIANLYQNISIFNTTNNSLIFKGENLIYFNSSLCITECIYQCINSTCVIPDSNDDSSSNSSSSSSSNSNSSSSNSSSSSSSNSNSNSNSYSDSSINSINSLQSYININIIIITLIVIIIIV